MKKWLLLISVLLTGFIIKAQTKDEAQKMLENELSKQTMGMIDFENIKSAIEHGADVNTVDKEGWTALIVAVAMPRIDIAEFLIGHGANINVRDNNGEPLLFYAVIEGGTEMTKFLLDKGVDINIKDNLGLTALHKAVFKQNVPMIKFLLEHGADVNAQSGKFNTPYNSIWDKDNDEIKRLLKSYNAKIYTTGGLEYVSDWEKATADAENQKRIDEENARKAREYEDRKKKYLEGPYYAYIYITSDPAGAEVYNIDQYGNKEDWGATSDKNSEKQMSRVFSSTNGNDKTFNLVLEKRDRTKKYSFTVHYKYYGNYTDYSEIKPDAKTIKIILQAGEDDK